MRAAWNVCVCVLENREFIPPEGIFLAIGESHTIAVLRSSRGMDDNADTTAASGQDFRPDWNHQMGWTLLWVGLSHGV